MDIQTLEEFSKICFFISWMAIALYGFFIVVLIINFIRLDKEFQKFKETFEQLVKTNNQKNPKMR